MPTPVHTHLIKIFLQPQEWSPVKTPNLWTHIPNTISNHYTTSKPTQTAHESRDIAYKYVHLQLHTDMHICCPVTATKPWDLGHTFHMNQYTIPTTFYHPSIPEPIYKTTRAKTCNDPFMTSTTPYSWPLGAPDQLHNPRLIQTRNPDLFHHSIIIVSSFLISLVSSHIIMDRHVTYPLPPCTPDHLFI